MNKYLVDTCGWIEWLIGSPLASIFEPYLKQTELLIVPTLVQYELYKWIAREKNIHIALEIIGITSTSIVVSLDTELALFAADLSKQHDLAMADAIVYATAIKMDAELITSDKHFAQLTQIKFFEKNLN